jgi:hypothetical protein
MEAPFDRAYLEQFAPYTLKHIRVRSDIMTQFESIEVGCHFDVDVAGDGGGTHGNEMQNCRAFAKISGAYMSAGAEGMV